MPAFSLPHAEYFTEACPLMDCRALFEKCYYPYTALSGSLAGLLQWQDHFTYFLASRDNTQYLLAFYGDLNAYLPLPPKPLTRQSVEVAFGYLDLVNGSGASGITRIEGLTGEESRKASSWGYPSRRTLVEYLYERAGTAGLHGDPYRAKRAEVNHLLKHHAVSFRRYQPGDETACRDVFSRWSFERAGRLKGAVGEKMLRHAALAHERVLKEGADWGLQGWVVEVEEEVTAYTFGAPLSSGTFGVLLEVADLTVKGLSAYIFSRLCGSLDGFGTINAGDAEELPGLAEAKEHWHPVQRSELFAVDGRR